MNVLFLTLATIDSLAVQGTYADLLREFAKAGHSVYVASPVERLQEVYEKLDRYEVQEFLRNVVTRQRASLACIYPTNQEETT